MLSESLNALSCAMSTWEVDGVVMKPEAVRCIREVITGLADEARHLELSVVAPVAKGLVTPPGNVVAFAPHHRRHQVERAAPSPDGAA